MYPLPTQLIFNYHTRSLSKQWVYICTCSKHRCIPSWQSWIYAYLRPTILYTSWIRSYFTYLNPEFPHRAHFHTRYWTEVIFRYYGTFCSASNSCHSLQERTTRPLFNITCIILLNSKHHNVAFISIKNPILTPITPDINNGAFDGF